jgi:EmrB/QacA subfamily drug resistance transporter
VTTRGTGGGEPGSRALHSSESSPTLTAPHVTEPAATRTGPGEGGSPTAPPQPARHKWWLLLAVMVGTFMGPFDGTVVNIALPTLTDVFGVRITTVEWVVLSYLLTVSTLLLVFGRLGDMIGLKRIYLAGYAIFVLGSLACALSWNIWSLIAFRALQALGAGMLFSVGPAIITRGFPGNERGKALGLVGVSVAVGLALGPTLGGLIIGFLDWRWIFLVNLPIGVLAFILAQLVLPRDEPRGQRFDLLGAGLSFVALFSLLLALSQGEHWGWTAAPTVALLGLALVTGTAFIRVELRVPQPMLDLGLFANRLFASATSSAVAGYIVTSTVMFTMPFYLMRVRDFPVEQAGLILTPVPLATAVVGVLSGTLSDRIGSRLLSTTGLVVSALGAAGLATLAVDTPTVGIMARLLLVGTGMGLFQSPNSSAIMGSVSRARLGIASGVVAVARNVGMLLGVSLAGMVLAVRQPHHLASLTGRLGEAEAAREAFLLASHDAAWVAAAICLVGAAASLTRGDEAHLRRAA